MFSRKDTAAPAPAAPKYKAGDIVIWSRGHANRSARYLKLFRADDGDLFHQVIEISPEVGKAMPALAEDADLTPFGDREFFARRNIVYRFRDGAPADLGSCESDAGAAELVGMLEKARRAPTADQIYAGLEHGSVEHRAWLRSAIDAIYAGEAVPAPLP